MKVFTSIEQVQEYYTPEAFERKKLAEMTPFELGEHLAKKQLRQLERRLNRWPHEVLEAL